MNSSSQIDPFYTDSKLGHKIIHFLSTTFFITNGTFDLPFEYHIPTYLKLLQRSKNKIKDNLLIHFSLNSRGKK